MTETRLSAGRLSAAGLLLVLGFLPIVNWIPGGLEAPWFSGLVLEWGRDAVLVLGAGVVLTMVSGRFADAWPAGRFTRLAAAAGGHPRRAAVILALGAFLLYAMTALWVHGAKPLLIDEILQVWQGRVLALGQLWVPAPEFPEFSSATNLVEFEGRRFSQYPMGGAAMLALGSLLRAEWLVGPVFGAVSVVLVWAIVRRAEARASVALAATLVFALAPFTVFMAGSHMNHVTALTWLLVGVAGLVGAAGREVPRARDGLMVGLGFGVAATIRPVDGFAFALPAAAWLLHLAWNARSVRAVVAASIGVAIPGALLLAANAATTGHPLVFAYSLLWEGTQDIGFHTMPWGGVHTPARGLELVNVYLLRLQQYFLEAPIPGLLPVVVGLALAHKFTAFDRYLLAAAGLLLGLYFAYWHEGFHLGPRFMYPLLPLLALWTARSVPALRSVLPSSWSRGLAITVGTAGVLAISTSIPIRALEYANQLQSSRFDHDAVARRAGVRSAVVLVRESWGAEIVARMWALGVPRSDVEFIYPRVDTCRLDLAVLALETDAVEGSDVTALLRGLTTDSASLQRSTLSPDQSQRVLAGAIYPERCLNRLAMDATGFTIFPPALLAGADDNVYLRDLGPHNSRVLAGLAGRPIYLLKPPGSRIGAMPEFVRVTAAEALREVPTQR